MPALIRVAHLKQLVDVPEGNRKLHHRAVPTLGGVAIFLSLLVCLALWLPRVTMDPAASEEWGVLLAAIVVIFFMGLKDDIIGLSPSKKLLIHLLIGGLLIFEGGFRVQSFGGLFGLEQMNFYVSSAFSLFVYIVIVNAINLVDGVDGLAGGFTGLAGLVFGFLFWSAGAHSETIVSLCLAGSLLAFLRFNWSPAQIFLGDSGSLIIGLTMYVLAVQLMNCDTIEWPSWLSAIPKPVMSMTLLAYPLVDTLRVFTLRLLKGRSPFSPDRNHLHHRLMSLGWGHRRTSVTVFAYSGFIIALNLFIFNALDWPKTLLFIVAFACSFLLFVPILRESEKAQIQPASKRVSENASSSSASI